MDYVSALRHNGRWSKALREGSRDGAGHMVRNSGPQQDSTTAVSGAADEGLYHRHDHLRVGSTRHYELRAYRPFTDADGRIIPGSIATMETAMIGGIQQSIWFRGVNTANPVLILFGAHGLLAEGRRPAPGRA